VRVATLDGKRLAVTARVFVLAAGLENARLLLLSNDRSPAGLGNEHDTVGRWFTGVLNLVSGRGLLARDAGFHRFYDIDGWHDPAFPTHTDTVVGLELTADLQARERIGGYAAFIAETYQGEYDAAFLSLRRIINQLKHGQMPDSLESDIAAIMKDPGTAAMGLYGQLAGSAGTRQYRLHHLFEQVPNPESRLMLNSERDRLGLPKMRVDWRLSELDKRTLLSGQTQVAQALGAAGVGRLQVDPALEEAPWPDGLRHTGAFTGTTRASEDPRRGVVDRNGQVHGMSNLYITGPSVFPTGVGLAVGWPIVALAIRLADYLKL
jgi:choline dehydrogenase-like flavoprotein